MFNMPMMGGMGMPMGGMNQFGNLGQLGGLPGLPNLGGLNQNPGLMNLQASLNANLQMVMAAAAANKMNKNPN